MIEHDSPFQRAYGWAAAPLSRLAEHDLDLLRMVLGGGPGTLHTFAAVIAEREAALLADPAGWAHRMAHAPRQQLLQHAYGSLPPGFPAALGKLGHEVAPREAYRALLRAFSISDFALVLRRRSKITPAFIALLNTPEARPLNSKLLMRLSFDDSEGVEALREALVLRSHTEPWSDHLEQLRSCETPKQLLHWLEYRWERPFPAPPWPGDDLLEPVRDATALRRLGSEMRNCLAEQVIAIGRGTDYVYVTRSLPRIAVGLRLRAGRWFATQILEGRNRRPQSTARGEVVARLIQAGIPVDLDHETYALIERALERREDDDLRFGVLRRLG